MKTDVVPSRVLLLLPDEDTSIVSTASPIRLASLYYQLKEAGFELVFATRSGGFSAVVGEMRGLLDSPAVAMLMADPFARDELSESVPLERVYTEDFDALIVFVEGSELAQPDVGRLMSEFLDIGKAVVASEVLDPVDGAIPDIRSVFLKPS